jgi:spore coat polysaccharide biosynthesis protein SpsF (cytidylyltransferase family)
MRIIAIIQARLKSTRLPGKVLMDLAGKPMLDHVIERACEIPGITEVVLNVPATDTELMRGTVGTYLMPYQEQDVLGSYLHIARSMQADVIVRLTGDCPFLDPQVSAHVIALVTDGHVSYATNDNSLTDWADGLDTQAFTRETLEAAAGQATGTEREHVCPWMAANRSRLMLHAPLPMRHLKWSVDTAKDLDLAQRMMGYLVPRAFSWRATLGAWELAMDDH